MEVSLAAGPALQVDDLGQFADVAAGLRERLDTTPVALLVSLVAVVTEATVKLKVAGELRHEVGEVDGPVNALDAALRKALNGNFPNLRAMRLVDYKVRVVNSEAGTAARIRVSIESADEHDVWGTVGVSENIIEASWIALNDAIEYKLYKDEIR